jgi:tetratricopeptide (TPR) repeat protein
METTNTREFVTKKIWPVIVSLSGAVVMILAFFIPSIQDQWDRYEARSIVQQYVEIGNDFVKEGNYKLAEEAFAKAFALSEEKRLDIEVKRLSAKVNLIYEDPVWGSEPPEGLEEVDFELLLHLQKGPEHALKRASILTSYGIYLASMGKPKKAEEVILEAIRLNPRETLAYINLGNLLDQVGKKAAAEEAYQKAIAMDPKNARAHYNLGLLFAEQNKMADAEKELVRSVELNPDDSDAVNQLRTIQIEMRK